VNINAILDKYYLVLIPSIAMVLSLSNLIVAGLSDPGFMPSLKVPTNYSDKTIKYCNKCP